MRLAQVALGVLFAVNIVLMHRLHLGRRLFGLGLDRLGHVLLRRLGLLLEVALAVALALQRAETALTLFGRKRLAALALRLALNRHLGGPDLLLFGHLDGRLGRYQVLGLELLKGNLVVSGNLQEEHAVTLAGQSVAGKGKGGGSHCLFLLVERW